MRERGALSRGGMVDVGGSESAVGRLSWLCDVWIGRGPVGRDMRRSISAAGRLRVDRWKAEGERGQWERKKGKGPIVWGLRSVVNKDVRYMIRYILS